MRHLNAPLCRHVSSTNAGVVVQQLPVTTAAAIDSSLRGQQAEVLTSTIVDATLGELTCADRRLTTHTCLFLLIKSFSKKGDHKREEKHVYFMAYLPTISHVHHYITQTVSSPPKL